jgi:hypothetical protein
MARNRNRDQEDQESQEVEEILETPVDKMRPTQRAVYEMLLGIEQIATEDTEDRGAIGEDVARILLAETSEEMWDADELPRYNAKVLSGCELEIYGFEAKFSTDPEITSGLIGPQSHKKMYLLVKSARLNANGQDDIYRLPEIGEEFQWNTSARFIVAKLYWMLKHGKFDNGQAVKARIQGTELGGGKSVEKLKDLSSPATVQGKAEEVPF